MTDRFAGRWELDVPNARVWDAQSERYVPDEVGREIITIGVANGVQDYEVLYGDDPIVRMGYTAPYDDAAWAPYEVREVLTTSSEPPAAAVARFRQRIRANEGQGVRHMEVGALYAQIRLVWIDDRTHYRIGKAADGTPQSALLRRLSQDGRSYMTSLMDATGVVFRIRPFRRVG